MILRFLTIGADHFSGGGSGDVLDVDVQYLRRSAARVYLIGAFTMYLVAQHRYPEHKGVAHRMLLSASHEFLQAKLTKMAERLIDFAEHSKASFDNALSMKFGINRALAKLLEPGIDSSEQVKNAEHVLDQYDWSVVTPMFELALACIRRDYSNLIPLAKAAHSAGLTYKEVRNFVVFKEALQEDGFLECFPKSNLLLEDQSGSS